LNLFGSGKAADLSQSDSFLVDYLVGRKSSAGVRVSPTKSMTLSAYYACIRNISEDVGKLPVKVYENTSDGKKRVMENPTDKLLTGMPNDEMTRMTFKEVLTAHALGWGNGYAEIQRNGRGEPVALYPIHPARVLVERNGDDQIVYKVYPYQQIQSQQSFEPVPIPQRDMIHLKGLGGDGLVGYSVVKFARESLGTAIATQEFGGTFFGNGLTLGGVLETPNTLTKEAAQRLVESWENRHKGADNAHKIAVLEQGLKWSNTSIPPKDAQFIELRQFQTTEIARWFRMPPHKIQDLERGTFSNIEHQSIEYVQDTIMSWLIRWEQEIERKLLTNTPYFAKFNVNALLRGDQKSRSEFYRNMFNLGTVSINEIRAFEDMNGIGEEGDKYFMQLNMTTVDKVVEGQPAAETGGRTMTIEHAIEIMKPVIERTIKRVNDKERKACQRAEKRDDREQWAEKFYEDQLNYAETSLEPICFSIVNLLEMPLQKVRDLKEKIYHFFSEIHYHSNKSHFIQGGKMNLEDLVLLEDICICIKDTLSEEDNAIS